MFRKLLGLSCLGLIVAGSLHAEEIKGKIKNITPDKTRMTLSVAAKDRTLDVARDAKVFGTFSQKFRRPVQMEIANGVAGLQPNQDVIAVTEIRDRRELVTQIKIQGTQSSARPK